MSARKAEILQTLAERGRPLLWANAQDAAALSGVGDDAFRNRVKTWEARGFPKVNPENGKRSIPAILAFWGMPQNHLGAGMPREMPLMDDSDGQETWVETGQGKRRAS